MIVTVQTTNANFKTTFKTEAEAEAALVSIKSYADGLDYCIADYRNGFIINVYDDGNFIDTL